MRGLYLAASDRLRRESNVVLLVRRRNPDFNANDLEGVGYSQFTLKDGRRCSTSTAYLTTARNRLNLDIWTDTHVTGILFNGRQATSVVCRRGGIQKKIEAS